MTDKEWYEWIIENKKPMIYAHDKYMRLAIEYDMAVSDLKNAIGNIICTVINKCIGLAAEMILRLRGVLI